MNTNIEKVDIKKFRKLSKEEQLQKIKNMIYNFADRIHKYEVAYIESDGFGFKCILATKCPLFDEPHKLHDLNYWKSWFKKQGYNKEVPGRYITIASTGNGLFFKKIKINLENYI